MNKKYLGLAIIVIILGVIFWFRFGYRQYWKPTIFPSERQLTGKNSGSYDYECDEHVMFRMMPEGDMGSIRIEPIGGAYPPTSTLTRKDPGSGGRYEANDLIFVGRGETVTLGEGESAINCSPVPVPDQAPFNFGN